MLKKLNLVSTILLTGALAVPGGAWADTAPVKQGVSISQQNGKVTCTVEDSFGPVVGASVVIKGTTNGNVSDSNGQVVLEGLKRGDIIQVSFIGYMTQEIPYTGQASIKIALKEDSQALDEVVIVGYGVQRKESLTGALQTLKDEKLTDITTPSVENMLNGKISGVFVAPGSGQPGAKGAVMVRGKATLSGSTAPLWVIDGVIVGDGAGLLNPADIETMTILKDAASTAIYGSEGANGVILITTKSAKSGKMQINASAKLGVSTLNNGNLKMMNGAELYDYYNSFNNPEMVNFTRWNPELRNSNFDWWDLATHAGFTQDYNLSISGGNENLKSYLSVGYYDEDGAVKGYDYSRYTFRYRSTYTPYKWLTIRPSISGGMRDVEDAQYSVTAMYSMLPWDSPYDEKGNLVPDRYQGWVNSQQTNYLNDLSYGNHTDYKTYEFLGNLDFDIKITDWLTFRSTNSYQYTNYYYHSYSDPRSNGALGVNGRIEEYQSNTTRRYTNQLLNFNKIFGKHSVEAILAYEFKDYQGKATKAIGTGFAPGFEVLDVTALPEKVGGSLSESASQSFFMRANYSYDNRYVAELSLRRDGASNFGTDARYGNFYSISGGWNIHREHWFNADWVDALKLRASYGTMGNRPGELYPQYALYSVSANYDGVPGTLISQVGNPDLTWEQTSTFGLGLDANLFDNRLHIVLDYYNKYTTDVLYRTPISGITGVTSRWQNVGEISNKGIELTIGGDIIRSKDWNWSLEANLGHNKNIVEKLYGDDPDLEIIGGGGIGIAGEADKILKVGYSSDAFYMQEWAGVNPETGAPQWYTTDKDGSRVITEDYAKADQIICPPSTPKLFGGFNTTLNWKNIDLNAVFGYSIGGKIYNYSRQEYDSDGAYTDRNQMKLKDGWSRWEKPGDIATHPVASYNNQSGSQKASTRYLENSDFLKLRSLTIGYNLSLPQYYIQNMRIFFAGENLFTITGYSGVDPEIPAKDGTTVIGSVGPSVYPSTRKFMFGLNLTF
ncbi:TonB-dependent receptor [Parabacteroides acidifaciens]|uniref:TonB-dependent receptor n=1 Tax=Parabacteroides acidifaciens TaxID=2290935 RepID=A0A3D8HCZ3_9BACT|nr:TonB-dependent receptor [Parabacteroides acidifaciens]MBC8602518.1 TonB-dependent receptor [Parabacteroides acidifaciens]RDU48761.1 TonB-dependent receptor [Parabacteroides acidifaciens]